MPYADPCAPGHQHWVTASCSRGALALDHQPQGQPVPPAQGRDQRTLPAAPKSTWCPGPISPCLKVQIPLTGDPSSQSPHPHTCPPHGTQGCCKQQRPTATRSFQATVARGRVPQPGEGTKPGHPVLPSQPRGCAGQGRPAHGGESGREGASSPAGARGTGRQSRCRYRQGRHLLSAVGRGARRRGQGRAWQGAPYLPGGSSLRRGRRPLRSVPARERPSRRPPRPAGTGRGAAPARLPPAPPPGAPRHPERARGRAHPAALPRGAAARSPPGLLGVRTPPREPRRARPARPPLPPRCGGPGPEEPLGPRHRFPALPLDGTGAPRIAACPGPVPAALRPPGAGSGPDSGDPAGKGRGCRGAGEGKEALRPKSPLRGLSTAPLIY